ENDRTLRIERHPERLALESERWSLDVVGNGHLRLLRRYRADRADQESDPEEAGPPVNTHRTAPPRIRASIARRRGSRNRPILAGRAARAPTTPRRGPRPRAWRGGGGDRRLDRSRRRGGVRPAAPRIIRRPW